MFFGEGDRPATIYSSQKCQWPPKIYRHSQLESELRVKNNSNFGVSRCIDFRVYEYRWICKGKQTSFVCYSRHCDIDITCSDCMLLHSQHSIRSTQMGILGLNSLYNISYNTLSFLSVPGKLSSSFILKAKSKIRTNLISTKTEKVANFADSLSKSP